MAKKFEWTKSGIGKKQETQTYRKQPPIHTPYYHPQVPRTFFAQDARGGGGGNEYGVRIVDI
jgi:hypothetical protein